jgi:hypothetical protein
MGYHIVQHLTLSSINTIIVTDAHLLCQQLQLLDGHWV